MRIAGSPKDKLICKLLGHNIYMVYQITPMGQGEYDSTTDTKTLHKCSRCSHEIKETHYINPIRRR